MIAKVIFVRIGRDNPGLEATFEIKRADRTGQLAELSEAIFFWIRRKKLLRSKSFDVSVLMASDQNTGIVQVENGRFGVGSVVLEP